MYAKGYETKITTENARNWVHFELLGHYKSDVDRLTFFVPICIVLTIFTTFKPPAVVLPAGTTLIDCTYYIMSKSSQIFGG